MTRRKVLLLEPLHDEATAWLAERVDAVEGVATDLCEGASQVEALIVRGATTVDADLLARLPSLRVVARAGVGVDNIDLQAAAAMGVRVLHVPHALTETVAEHAIALALALRREVVSMAAATRAGRWKARDSYRGDSIAGARVAVVGMGSIGRRTADLLRALGADVVTWNRSTMEASVGLTTYDLDEALDGAEAVSLHVALTSETYGFIGKPELDRLAAGATVINTARPEIVDRAAILAALESGRVRAYGVDGFAPAAPLPDDELLGHPGVLVTPHVAALTSRAFKDLSMATARGVANVLEYGEARGLARFV